MANGGCDSRVTDIVIDGSIAYVTAESQRPGCWEGVYSADVSDGALNFNYTCLGGSTSLAVANGWLYRGSHNHDCAKNAGGYTGPRTDIRTWTASRSTAWWMVGSGTGARTRTAAARGPRRRWVRR